MPSRREEATRCVHSTGSRDEETDNSGVRRTRQVGRFVFKPVCSHTTCLFDMYQMKAVSPSVTYKAVRTEPLATMAMDHVFQEGSQRQNKRARG